MKLKRLLKRYEKTRKKASKMYEKIVEAYEEAYTCNDIQTVEEIYNSIRCGNAVYHLIFKDFNKKGEL